MIVSPWYIKSLLYTEHFKSELVCVIGLEMALISQMWLMELEENPYKKNLQEKNTFSVINTIFSEIKCVG